MKDTGLYRAYQAFTRCHDMVAAATEEHALLREFCSVAVRELGFRLAWVGLVNPGDMRVRPVAQAGFEDGYLDRLDITVTDGPRSAGPTGTAIRTGKTSVCQDIARDPRFEPWRGDALQRGYASSASIPLREGGRCMGAINLYAAEPDAFDDDELALLEEVALTLVIGMARLRTAARVHVLESGLQRAAVADTAGSAAAVLAHDLNNQLMVSAMALESACEQAGESSPLQEDLLAALNATRDASTLIRRLLALFRPGPATPTSARSQPDTELVGARQLLTRLAAPAQLQLEADAPGCSVGLGPVDVERMVVNLVVNAKAASPAGSVITVRTEVRDVPANCVAPRGGPVSAGPHLVLTVEDHGAGMTPDALAHLFEPFFTTKGRAGSGLGLSSVLGLARGVGGSVDVVSAPGTGTTVSVFLPVVPG